MRGGVSVTFFSEDWLRGQSLLIGKRKGAPEGALLSCLAGFSRFLPGLVASPLPARRPGLQKIHADVFVPIHEGNKNPIHLEFLLYHRTDEREI
jgi:hypothetical protein